MSAAEHQPVVLLVEDDEQLRELLADGLRREALSVLPRSSAATALDDEALTADLAVIDIGLPDADGRDLCQAMRARGFSAPVLFLTALGDLSDKLAGFAAGADDYVTKPVATAELVMRVRAILRRTDPHQSGAAILPVALDPTSHGVRGELGLSELTATEYRLLSYLLARATLVVRRAELIGAAWPPGALVHDNTLDQYIARLRRKLAGASGNVVLTTVRGVGYRLHEASGE